MQVNILSHEVIKIMLYYWYNCIMELKSWMGH